MSSSNLGKLCLILFYRVRCLIRNKFRVSSLKVIKFLLVLLIGGGLQRIQRSYKSHLRELPLIWKIRVHLRVTLV
jgi:hypothetical protein